MRTADEMEAMKSHPVSETDDRATAPPADEPSSPYRSFFDALEELEDNKTLYGKASFEAEIARRRVATAREAAIAEWRNRQAA
jgi:hypothetical protein